MEKRERNAPIWVIFKILNFVLLLYTGYVWLTFSVPPRGMNVLITCGMLLCCLIGNFRLQFTSRVPVLILVLISIFLLSYIVRDAISAQILLGVLIPTLIVYMLPAERQCDLLKSIADWYGIMMLIRLVLFFAVQVVSIYRIHPTILSLSVSTGHLLSRVIRQ